MPDLRPLFSPDSVAIIGASGDTHTLRGRTTEFLIAHGYPGRVYPVTRSQPEVFGLRSYASVADLPEAPDLAVIVVPAAYVAPTLEECGKKGVRAAVIISSGFAEERGAAAQARDEALRQVIARYGIIVCGPNSEGIVNPLKPLVATFSPVFHDPKQSLFPISSNSRAIAVSCQSGALTFAFLSRGRPRQLRFTYQASAGNQICLEAHDYLDWLIDAGGADIFIAYLESIQDPARFRAVAEKAAAAGKPMILAKVGRSEAGRRAAASHTGSLANSGAIDDAIFRHHGIIRGEDLDHALDIAAAFAFCKLPKGNRVAVITGSGGSAVWMSDILTAHGLELPVLEEDLQQRLMALLPSYASAQNPVDGTAQAIHEVGYAKLVEIVRESRNIDTILLIGSLANEATAKTRAEELAAVTGATEQPIILSTYTTATEGAMAAFAEAGIPCYTSMPSCARAIRALVDYARFQARRDRAAPPPTTPPASRDEAARGLALAGRVLTENRAKALLAGYGIPRPPEALAVSADRGRRRFHPDRRRGGAQGAIARHHPQDRSRRRGARHRRRGRGARGLCAGSSECQGRPSRRRGRRRAGAADGAARGRDHPRHYPRPGVRPDADGRARRHPCRGVARRRLLAGADRPGRGAGIAWRAERRGPARRRPWRPARRPRRPRELIAALSRFAADHADRIDEIDLNPVILHPEGQGLTIVDALIVKR